MTEGGIMKKLFSSFVAFAAIFPLSLGLALAATTATAAPSIEMGDFINLSETGAYPGPNSGHGNHQTRCVHTSHGDYCAYITDSYPSQDGTVDVWSLFKVDFETGTSEVIFTGEKYYDSSQVSLLVDKDENVWAITSTSDNRRNISTEGLDMRAHKLDAKTGEVTSYTGFASGGPHDGYGYGTSFYDEKNNRIICMHAGGDYRQGSTKGASFNWTYFDMTKNRWSRTVYTVGLEARHCYMYGFVDENGGLMLMAQRDIKISSIGYPEVGNDYGITEADRSYMWDNYIFRHSANYAWDELDLYYIPDITKAEIYSYNIVEADYSRVTGTQNERYTFEKRISNYYPANQNNNGGDFLWTQTEDGRRLLHITYNSAYIQAAMARSVAMEDIWYHQVWDITDPTAAKKLYCAPISIDGRIADGVENGGGYSFRLYRDTNGTMYLISAFDPKTDKVYYKDGATKYETQYDAELTVWRIAEFHESYFYIRVGKTKALPGGGSLINISSHRGGSITDNRVNILYLNNDGSGDYVFTCIDIFHTPCETGDVNEDGIINAADINLLIRYTAGSYSNIDPNLADIDKSSDVNAKDINMFKRILSGV